MTAAILQGVPATTLDADLWIDLPPRSYIRVLNLCVKLGARVLANTVVVLSDDTLVNFLYRVDGLASFATEARRSLVLTWLGSEVRVLPLERIIRSKEFVGRPKDLAHLPLLRDVLRAIEQVPERSRSKP
jgi:hypothetical protein